VEVKLETVPVATAVADIGWGTRITKEMIKPVDFLKATAPPGCFSDGDSLVGRVAILPIKANEPILDSRLAPDSIKEGGVAAVVGQKKRAVAVKVDKVIGVSGFIHHGNRVDVLVTIPMGKNSAEPIPMTKTVLENILVLTVGPELEKKGKDEKPSDVDVITLEVTPEEGEKLALAANEGKLQLALRNFSDTENVLTRGVTIPALLASYSLGGPVGGKAPKTEAPAPKPRPYTVELVKGSKVTEIKFERSE
jgi:pilus assembly protein CpaB